MKNTCGECHNYDIIKKGWHFNAGDSAIDSGREGHPWIFVDQQSSTQIPLSLRRWPGTYLPQQIGMSTMEFLQRFGRHMPGGGSGEDEGARSLNNLFRWMVSGDLEINCLSCHDAEFAHDQADYAAQITRQNFRWAATASSAFAWVRGTAKDMPDNYDIYSGSAPDLLQKMAPQVFYDPSRFNYKNEVFFDVVRKIPNENCYFCHSTKIIDSERTQRWHYDDDVHLTSGLLCVDCHRNGLDHNIVRGYEERDLKSKNSIAVSLSCRGCHMGNDEDPVPISGRLGAPKPVHYGIPALHFDKLTCTACHSGEWPASNLTRVKTSAAHALGMHGVNKSDNLLPHIITPVLKKMVNGKIAPHNLIWPAFWAQMNGDTLLPLDVDLIRPITEAYVVNDDTLHRGDWLDLTTVQISKILDSLSMDQESEGSFVYISGGFIYHKSDEGTLLQESHPAAQPYSWPIAHDVRPAEQSLGVRGCNDCHATDSPFYFAQMKIDSPLDIHSNSSKRMIEFQDKNIISAWVFSFSFLFRPWLKFIVILSCLIIIGVLILYAFKALSFLIHSAVDNK
jgi:hypothetical protein